MTTKIKDKILLKLMEFGYTPRSKTYLKFFRDRLKEKKAVIIDAGANEGVFTGQISSILKNNCTIHCFEPLPEKFSFLQKKYKNYKNIILYNKALGSENNTINFNVALKDCASSVLKPTSQNIALYSDISPVNNTIKVEQIKLDSVLNEETDLLKCDLQGYDLEALKGSRNLLNKTKMIFIEVSFADLYENQCFFRDIDSFLSSCNFVLFNFYNVNYSQKGQIIFADALYTQKDFL